MQSPPFPRYLVPPRSKYSPQHHILKHPQLPFLPQYQRPSFTPIKNNRQNYSSLHEYPFKCMVTSRTIVPATKNVSYRFCGENQNPHFMFDNFFFPQNRAVYEIMWKNSVEPDRPQMTIKPRAWSLHALDQGYRHTLRICNTAFPRPQRLRERASMLYLYIRHISCLNIPPSRACWSAMWSVVTGAIYVGSTLINMWAHPMLESVPRLMFVIWRNLKVWADIFSDAIE